MSKKTRKIFQNLSAVLCLCLVLVAMPGGVLADIAINYFEGSGTASDPYQIADKEDMYNLSDAMRDESYHGKYYELIADIDMNDELSVDAIGEHNFITIDEFSGFLDGKGFKIENLTANYINHDSLASTPSVAFHTSLFGVLVNGSIIKNIVLDNVNINSPDGSAAALVNQINSGAVVQNVIVNGFISGSTVGGIAVKNYGSILSCNNYAEIESSDYIAAGGIVAENYGYIEGCSNEGDISGYRVGGLVGRMKSPSSIKSVDTYEILAIINSENHGSISGVLAGGLVNTIESGAILNSYNSGSVI